MNGICPACRWDGEQLLQEGEEAHAALAKAEAAHVEHVNSVAREYGAQLVNARAAALEEALKVARHFAEHGRLEHSQVCFQVAGEIRRIASIPSTMVCVEISKLEKALSLIDRGIHSGELQAAIAILDAMLEVKP